MPMTTVWIRFAVLALPLVVLPAAIADEPAAARFGGQVEVEVVNVDVVAVDREGRPVLDLGREDFELRVDGRPVAIEYFTGPAATAPDALVPALPQRAAAQTNSAPLAEAPLRPAAASLEPAAVVVFVDQSALEWHTSRQIVGEIREYLLPRVDAGERVFVATFTDDLRILADGTSGRDGVLAAIDEIDRMRGRGTRIASARNYLERDIRTFDRYMDLEGAGRSGQGGVSIRGVRGERVNSQRVGASDYLTQQIQRLKYEIELYGREEMDRQRHSLDALQHFVDALSPLEGRKAVLLATAGYTTSPTAYLSALLEIKRGRRGPRHDFSGVDPMQATTADLNDRFESMLRVAQNARIAFYTIAARTPPPVQNSAEFPSMGRHNEQTPPRDIGLVEASTSVVQLADATGGRALYVDDGLSDRLATVDQDRSAAYSLGFPIGPEAGDGDHQIAVRVLRPGVEVRHRTRFRRQSLGELTAQAVTSAAALGAAENVFGITLELGEPKPDSALGRIWRLPFAVGIPLGDLALVPDETGRSGRLRLQIALRDANGDLRVSDAAPIDIRVPAADLETALASRWVHRAELRLPAGSHRIAVVITDEGSGLHSTALAKIDIVE